MAEPMRKLDENEKIAARRVDTEALDRIFLKARTFHGWLKAPVNDELLHEIYDLMKWGPTSYNSCPGRVVYVKDSPEAREKLLSCLDKGNLEQTRSAPVTAILAYDLEFYEKLATLAPGTGAKESFLKEPKKLEENAFRNGTLQGAYFMLAARAVGLDCGGMSGFNNRKLDNLFFEGTSWRSNFLCNLGYGDPAKLQPRAPRLEFGEAVVVR